MNALFEYSGSLALICLITYREKETRRIGLKKHHIWNDFFSHTGSRTLEFLVYFFVENPCLIVKTL